MHITVEPGETHAILNLNGEFDTYFVPLLQEEIDALQKAGVRDVVLNLRMVRFINSTALGAILKHSKTLTAQGKRLLVSRPSAFCRDIMQKVGLDRVVPIFASDDDAVASLRGEGQAAKASLETDFAEDPSTILFRLVDQKRLRHFIEAVRAKNPVHNHAFGDKWAGVGSMRRLDDQGLSFTWSGGNTDLSAFDMGQMLAVGTELSVKFRLPLLQRGFCEATCEISDLEERPDGVKVGCTFTQIDDATRESVRQYAEDMAHLKQELKRVTDK